MKSHIRVFLAIIMAVLASVFAFGCGKKDTGEIPGSGGVITDPGDTGTGDTGTGDTGTGDTGTGNTGTGNTGTGNTGTGNTGTGNTGTGNTGTGDTGTGNTGTGDTGTGNTGTGNTGTGGDNGDDKPTVDVPKDTKTVVYYTNSERWSKVYAYVWNYATEARKAAWPGEELSAVGMSDYYESQYAIEVDYSVYDRVIFNDGSGKQTNDLVVGAATSGYYGKDGIFTMGTDDYGKVEYFTLRDANNLNYLTNSSKKISVYTPSGYTTSKKYGVLYMFDSQNLYIAANGAEQSHDDYGSWAVDVGVTNLVKNGGDGVIIVAIDNTDGHRDQELTMSQSFGTLTELGDPKYGDFRNGKLDNLGDFMRQTLMPWVSSHYSVDTSRAKTGIAGSSSGGLAAYYLGLRDNDLYGYIGAFSPANGLFNSSDWARFYASKNFGAVKPKIYVYCGKNDRGLEDMLLPAVKQIKNLTSYGFAPSDIVENYLDGATHSENYWRIAFTEFLSFSSF